MSAPDTNVERQEMKHKPALLGIRGAMLFGVLMVLVVVFYAAMQGSGPDAVGTIEGSTVTTDTVAPGTNESN